jgi:glutamate-5-semialdehyde dehydrogenase
MNSQTPELTALMHDMGRHAKQAAAVLALAPRAQKDAALMAAAQALRARSSAILEANALDMQAGRDKGLSAAMLDRLELTPERIDAMARGLEDVAQLPDPVGKTLAEWDRPNGLKIKRISVPLGVIGIIYESRPNVTADAGSLCLKAGNAAILRGGSDSFHSSGEILLALQEGLRAAGLPEACVQRVPTTDRAAVGLMLRMDDAIDVVVPRGGRGLIERIRNEARMPVFSHLDGLCHTYVDAAADLEQAQTVVLNAKMRRTGICGATETLLVHQAVAQALLPDLGAALRERGCELRADARALALLEGARPATEADWDTEYLDAILSIKVVDGLEDAIAHINTHGSHHTEAVLSQDEAVLARFANEVDAGIIMLNASTQFADGGEFGMGAETI